MSNYLNISYSIYNVYSSTLWNQSFNINLYLVQSSKLGLTSLVFFQFRPDLYTVFPNLLQFGEHHLLKFKKDPLSARIMQI